jgi:hypothetical protein
VGLIANAPQQPRQVQLPFIRRPIGAGDLVAAATERAGIPSCTPCKRRQAALNQRLMFTPRGPSR